MREIIELIVGLDKTISSEKFECVTEAALDRIAGGSGKWSRTADALLAAPEGVWTGWKQLLASELIRLRGAETPRQPISAGIGQSIINTLAWNIAAMERRMGACQQVQADRGASLEGLDAPEWLRNVLAGMQATGMDGAEANPFAAAGRRGREEQENRLHKFEVEDLYQVIEDWYTVLSAVYGYVSGHLGRRLWPQPAYLVTLGRDGWLRFEDIQEAVQYCLWEIEHGS